MTYWSTLRPPLDDEVFDETGPGDDGSAERAREIGVHVGARAPVVFRRELQPDLVFEDVGRRVELYVQGAPEGDAHRGAVRGWCWVGWHVG